MRHQEPVVEPSCERIVVAFVQKRVRKNAGQLVVHHDLLDAVMIIESRLSSPADVDRGEHVLLGMLHEQSQVLPVIDFLKGNLLHRSTRDDHSVELLALDLIERNIKLLEMRQIFHLAMVRLHHDELEVYLKRCIGQHSHQLDLCGLQRRHEVQDSDLQRTYLLLASTGIGHDEYALASEFV